MLNKENILETLKKLNMPKSQYCIMTGAALVLMDVKEHTQDIDIGCTKELFADLAKLYPPEQKNGSRFIVLEEQIEIFEDWLPERIVYIEDMPVAELLWIRHYKQCKGREKDLRDIEQIDKYLAEQKKN